MSSEITDRDVYDEDAHGLTLPLLDSMLKARFTEGVQKGRLLSVEEVQESLAEVRRVAFDEGVKMGRIRAANEIYELLDVEAATIRRLLADLGLRTRSEPMRELIGVIERAVASLPGIAI